MIVIEAVRTGCWNAISGQRQVVTVEECADELRRGDVEARGYVSVKDQDLARITVQPLAAGDAAAFRLGYPPADGLDPGERDLLAYATSRTDDFELCSCDKAVLVVAHTLGWLDRVVSLEAVANAVGARPNPRLKVQFTDRRLSEWRHRSRSVIRSEISSRQEFAREIGALGVHFAQRLHAGWRGKITLELHNVGAVPLTLRL